MDQKHDPFQFLFDEKKTRESTNSKVRSEYDEAYEKLKFALATFGEDMKRLHSIGAKIRGEPLIYSYTGGCEMRGRKLYISAPPAYLLHAGSYFRLKLSIQNEMIYAQSSVGYVPALMRQDPWVFYPIDHKSSRLPIIHRERLIKGVAQMLSEYGAYIP